MFKIMSKEKNIEEVALFKERNEIKLQIEDMEKTEGVNWLGKWARSIRLERLYSRLASLEKKIQRLKNRGNK
jgi:hypothetical protein